MKKTTLLLFMLLSLSAGAQGVFRNQTTDALQQVIGDFPNQFRNIKGDRIDERQSGIIFQSKVALPGASSYVSNRAAGKPGGYSWLSELYTGSDFETCRQQFRQAFDHIKNSIVKVEGATPFIVNGQYEHPSETDKTTNIPFNLLPATGDWQRMRIELSLQPSGDKWKIVLRVYEANPA